jgi:hypothetical protein
MSSGANGIRRSVTPDQHDAEKRILSSAESALGVDHLAGDPAASWRV